MRYNCDLIRDLLPLYQDGVCSENSRQAVEEHLKECKGCTDYLEALRSSGEIEAVIDTERRDALSSQAKFFKRRSAIVGTVFAGLFMLPVLICLIVGLASGALSWVFVVMAAMLIPASLIVVPLMAYENKALWTLTSFAVSLTLLLGVCCIVSGGGWFFTAAAASLFGLSVVFSPFAVKAKPVAARLGGNKGLAVMALDTALYIIMMLCIGLSNGLGSDYYGTAASVSLPILICIWGVFAVIRYTKLSRLLKAAASLGLIAVITAASSLIFGLGDHSSLIYIETSSARYEFSFFAVLSFICIALAAVFALIKALTGIKGRKENHEKNN